MLVFALPRVADIARGAPKVSAHCFAPKPGFGGAPLANTQHNGPACGIERIANEGVSGLCILRRGVAPVVLQIVDAPGSVLQSVLIFMSQAAWSLGASHTARVGIDPTLQSQRVNVVRQRFDSRGKAFSIGYDVAALIALHLPAVVDHHVLIAGILHT